MAPRPLDCHSSGTNVCLKDISVVVLVRVLLVPILVVVDMVVLMMMVMVVTGTNGSS